METDADDYLDYSTPEQIERKELRENLAWLKKTLKKSQPREKKPRQTALLKLREWLTEKYVAKGLNLPNDYSTRRAAMGAYNQAYARFGNKVSYEQVYEAIRYVKKVAKSP